MLVTKLTRYTSAKLYLLLVMMSIGGVAIRNNISWNVSITTEELILREEIRYWGFFCDPNCSKTNSEIVKLL